MVPLVSEHPHVAYIGMGSNLGDSGKLVFDAWEALGAVDGILRVSLSSPYVTEPVGMESSNRFINAAACVRTSLSPKELLNRLLVIEKDAGRRRRSDLSGYQDRTLDLDLLLYDDLVMESVSLTLPHPKMLERLFVLQPLAEIAADLAHPVSGLTMGAHLAGHAQYGDESIVALTGWGEETP